MAEIVLDKITKRYSDGTEAIHEADFTIEDGEFFILVGPSGCGKSTLLNMIVGLEDISDGDLLVDGLVEPVAPANWFCTWWGRAVLGARVEWVGGVGPTADEPEPTSRTRSVPVEASGSCWTWSTTQRANGLGRIPAAPTSPLYCVQSRLWVITELNQPSKRSVISREGRCRNDGSGTRHPGP